MFVEITGEKKEYIKKDKFFSPVISTNNHRCLNNIFHDFKVLKVIKTETLTLTFIINSSNLDYFVLFFYVHIYIYIYMCVCLCVCVSMYYLYFTGVLLTIGLFAVGVDCIFVVVYVLALNSTVVLNQRRHSSMR